MNYYHNGPPVPIEYEPTMVSVRPEGNRLLGGRAGWSAPSTITHVDITV